MVALLGFVYCGLCVCLKVCWILVCMGLVCYGVCLGDLLIWIGCVACVLVWCLGFGAWEFVVFGACGLLVVV